MPDTVQILTPPGVAAIAVVRLCGAGVAAFCRAHLTRSPRAGSCLHTQLRDGEQIIDDPVVVLVDAQTLDLSLHGGTWVLERAVALARAAGFVEAAAHTPESVAEEVEQDVPRALTREAIAILLAQSDAWREMLKRDDRAAMQRALDDRALAYLLSPPVVAIVGAPNVGKSTLANQLFGHERSITADLPGTTRDWVGEQANIGGMVVTLVDTPGVRETNDDIEREAISRARSVISKAALIIEVQDATAPASERVCGAPIVVLNKADRIAPAFKARVGTILISARTGAGLAELSRAVRAQFGCDDLDSPHARCWTERQRDLLRERLGL